MLKFVKISPLLHIIENVTETILIYEIALKKPIYV